MKPTKSFLIGLVVCTIAGSAQVALAQQQVVTLNLTLETETGQPIENAPIQAASDVQSRFALTDASGKATFALTATQDVETLVVRMTHGGFAPIVPPDLRETAIDRFHALRDAYSFKPYYLIPVAGETISATVTPQEAVTITGRLVDADGSPRDGVVGIRGRISSDVVYDFEQGNFSLGGVPKGLAVELWFGANTQLHNLSLTANQTQQDNDIGMWCCRIRS